MNEKPFRNKHKYGIESREVIARTPHSTIEYTNDQIIINSIQRKNIRKKILILSAIPLVLIIFIALLFVVLKNNLGKSATVEEKESTNKIKATFSVNSGEKLQLINTKSIESNQYKITVIDGQNRLRRLDSIVNGENKFDFTGEISVVIEFNNTLNSSKSLFENVSKLKNINLTSFDTSNITSMDSMFSGCTTLENVTFDGIDTRKLNSMNYMFRNCDNLQEINMSPINAQNVKNMSSIFDGCKKLNSINISSFPNVEEDFLDGIKSKVNVITNEKIYDKLTKISLNSLEKKINLNIIINDFNDNDDSCVKGSDEKCKTCSNNIKGNCLLCNDGYYLPIHSNNKTVCTSCSVKDHCIKCSGQDSFVLCHECEQGYILKNNLCEKETETNPDKEEESCILGLDEKCVSCSEETGKKNQCDKCNEGYYLPTDKNENLKCESCKKIANCASCEGSLENLQCNKCEEGFKLISNECRQSLCEKGMKEKCLQCNMEKDKSDECLSCNPGYYIPDDATDRTKCVKCSLEGCKTCSGTSGNEKCIQCLNEPFMINGEIKTCSSCQIGSGENCLSCDDDNKCKTCNKGYKLVEGKCKLIENTFFAVYNSTSIDEPTKILCNIHIGLKLTDFQMYVNNQLVTPSIISINSLPYIVYKFGYIGLYNVTFSFNTTLKDNIGWMFGQCENLVSIRFSKTFDISTVTSIYNMFTGDYNLLSIDISSFDTSKVIDMSEVFYGCKSLQSLDLSNFDTSKVLRTRGMFEYCENLNYLDISSFNMERVKNTLNMFSFVSKTGTIKINNSFDNFKNLIPQNWTIIN